MVKTLLRYCFHFHYYIILLHIYIYIYIVLLLIPFPLLLWLLLFYTLLALLRCDYFHYTSTLFTGNDSVGKGEEPLRENERL